MGKPALYIGVFTKWHNTFCSTQYTHRPADVFASVYPLRTVAVSHFAQLICFRERNQNLYRSSSLSFCIRLVGNSVWLVFCCRPAQHKTLAECTIFLRHARACRCKPQRGNKPALSMSLCLWLPALHSANSILPQESFLAVKRLSRRGLLC
jgi:hypothetical protein